MNKTFSLSKVPKAPLGLNPAGLFAALYGSFSKLPFPYNEIALRILTTLYQSENPLEKPEDQMKIQRPE